MTKPTKSQAINLDRPTVEADKIKANRAKIDAQMEAVKAKKLKPLYLAAGQRELNDE